MAWRFVCWDCIDDPQKMYPRVFKAGRGRRGHEQRTSHITEELSKELQDILAATTRGEAEQLLAEEYVS